MSKFQTESICVTGPTRREACGSICRLLLLDIIKNTVRVKHDRRKISRGQGREIIRSQAEGQEPDNQATRKD